MAMPQEKRNLLQSKRIEILNTLDIGPLFMAYFRRDRILTAEMESEIMEPPIYTKRERVAKLLDRLPSRGALAFGRLIEALVETNQEHLAAILAPENVIIPQDETDSAAVWSSRQLDSGTLQHLVSMIELNAELKVQKSSVNDKYKTLNHGNYTMKKNIHGKALLIVIGDNSSSVTADLNTLGIVFKGLKFDVDVHTVVKEEAIKKLKGLAGQISSTDEACVVFILRCPPDVKTQEVGKLFEGDQCTALKGKPKLIFLQRPIDKASVSNMPASSGAGGDGGATGSSATSTPQQVSGDIGMDGEGIGCNLGDHPKDNMHITNLNDIVEPDRKSPVVTCLAYTFAELARYFSIIKLVPHVNRVAKELKIVVNDGRFKNHSPVVSQNTSISTFYFKP